MEFRIVAIVLLVIISIKLFYCGNVTTTGNNTKNEHFPNSKSKLNISITNTATLNTTDTESTLHNEQSMKTDGNGTPLDSIKAMEFCNRTFPTPRGTYTSYDYERRRCVKCKCNCRYRKIDNPFEIIEKKLLIGPTCSSFY